MKDKLKTDASRHPKEKTELKKAPKLEAAKGDDELMSQPPPQPTPEPVSIPQIDPHVKLARRETAQETIHEVMSKDEAKKLTSKKSKE